MPKPMNVVYVEPCGMPVVGIWCEVCLLPSAYGMVVLIGGNPAIVQRCDGCRRKKVA